MSKRHSILILDLGKPKFLLLPYFLASRGFSVREEHTLGTCEALLAQRSFEIILLNTVAYPKEVSSAVHRLREASSGALVAVFQFGPHREYHQPARAHLCIHNPRIVEDVMEPLRLFAGS